MTLKSYEHTLYLWKEVYGSICTNTPPRPWPPVKTGLSATQFAFSSKSLPALTAIHKEWYNWSFEFNKYIKIVPLNIDTQLTKIALAHWIMDDGYFDSYGRTKTVLLCTESFTKEECITLQSLLEKLEIKSTLKIRNKINDKYRIRISKTSMDRVIFLVKPYMHKDFLYKLGL